MDQETASEEAQRLKAKLSWLNTQDIPEVMRKRDIKGLMGDGSMCPVALLLRAEGFNVQVGTSLVALYRPGVDAQADTYALMTHIWMDHAIQAFINEFDKGRYPELEKEV